MRWLAASARPSMQWRRLEQDSDAVPGAAGHLGGGHPELSHSETAAWSQGGGQAVTGTARVESLLAGLAPHGAVGRVLDDPAPCGLEDPPVPGWCRTA